MLRMPMLRTTPRILNFLPYPRALVASLNNERYPGDLTRQERVRFYRPHDRQEEEKAPRRREERAMGITMIRPEGKDGGYCYGCGADLDKGSGVSDGINIEVTESRGGYWKEKKKILRKSKITNWALCARCRTLKNAHDGESEMSALAPNSRMTEVFRAEVSKIRKLQNVVVVWCIDAINCTGTLIQKIRYYVGGNPILLAITRCDLLPEYIADELTNEELQDYFYSRTKEISPAGIYLCSESPQHMMKYEGITALAADLWKHLDGRDTYIVGSANIGKSTLTDILINGFLNRGDRLNHFQHRIAVKRLRKLREARVTKSSLPGTTLQNIRVPCFVDHEQALWDTPGLLLDESLKHFPIKDFHRLRAMRPSTVQPFELIVPEKSFALLLYEDGDEQQLPLLRLEVRLKKNDSNGKEGPVKLVWNSTLQIFKLAVVEIDTAIDDERNRFLRARELDMEKRQRTQAENGQEKTATLSPEERKQRKEDRRRAFEERVLQEQREIGMTQWRKQEEKRKETEYQEKRITTLAKLSETGRLVIEGNVGMDVDIAHLGWFGILSPRATMITVFAPNTGVRVSCHASLALPKKWGSYDKPRADGEEDPRDEEFNVERRLEEEDDYVDSDLYDQYGYDGYVDDDAFSAGGMFDDVVDYEKPESSFRYVRGQKLPFYSGIGDDQYEHKVDPWAKYSGSNVGWKFDDDVRFSKNDKLVEGWNPIPKEKE